MNEFISDLKECMGSLDKPEVELHVESECIRQKVYLLDLHLTSCSGDENTHTIGVYSTYTKAHAKAEEVAAEIAYKDGIEGRLRFCTRPGAGSTDLSYMVVQAWAGDQLVADLSIAKATVDE